MVHRSQHGVLVSTAGAVFLPCLEVLCFSSFSSEFGIFAWTLLAEHPNLKSRKLRVRNFHSTDLMRTQVYSLDSRYSAYVLFQESWAGRAGPDVTGLNVGSESCAVDCGSQPAFSCAFSKERTTEFLVYPSRGDEMGVLESVFPSAFE